jgi:hypothetical protein
MYKVTAINGTTIYAEKDGRQYVRTVPRGMVRLYSIGQTVYSTPGFWEEIL